MSLSWLEITERIRTLWDEFKLQPDVARSLGDLSWEEKALIDARSKLENPYSSHNGADIILERGTIWGRITYDGSFPIIAERIGMRIYWAVNIQMMLTPLLMIKQEVLDKVNIGKPEKKFTGARGYNPKYFYRHLAWKPDLFKADKIAGDPDIISLFYKEKLAPHSTRLVPVPGMKGYLSTPLIYREYDHLYGLGDWGFLDTDLEG